MNSGIALELDEDPNLEDADEEDYNLEYQDNYKDNYDEDLSGLAKETVSEKLTNKQIDTTPVVTHTLVDLYCGQGHLEKALEILEKILLLNPNDQRTIDKKNEIKNLMSPQNSGYSDPLAESEEFTLETSEEDGRKELMDLIDERVNIETLPVELATVTKPNTKALEKKYQNFLKKIQKRALDYQARF